MKKNIGSKLALYPMPIIMDAPLTLECSVADIYETPNFESFICTIDNTYVAEEHLDAEGKINYNNIK